MAAVSALKDKLRGLQIESRDVVAGAYELFGRGRWNADERERQGGRKSLGHFGDEARAFGIETGPIAKMQLGMQPISVNVIEVRVDRHGIVECRECFAKPPHRQGKVAACLPDGRRL